MLVTENSSYFTVFIGQESRRNLAGCLWPRVFPEVSVQPWARQLHLRQEIDWVPGQTFEDEVPIP